SYGGRYDFTAQRLRDAEPIPAFLEPLRRRIATWAGRPPESFSHALIAEYTEGTRLGWHRDVPQFELVVGVSLLGPCRLRFRRATASARSPSSSCRDRFIGSKGKRAGNGSTAFRRRPLCATRSRSGPCAKAVRPQPPFRTASCCGMAWEVHCSANYTEERPMA